MWEKSLPSLKKFFFFNSDDILNKNFFTGDETRRTSSSNRKTRIPRPNLSSSSGFLGSLSSWSWKGLQFASYCISSAARCRRFSRKRTASIMASQLITAGCPLRCSLGRGGNEMGKTTDSLVGGNSVVGVLVVDSACRQRGNYVLGSVSERLPCGHRATSITGKSGRNVSSCTIVTIEKKKK